MGILSTSEIIHKIEDLREWESLAAEAAAEIESIKDEIKVYMNTMHFEELEAGTHIVRYSTVLSNRFDTTNFKKAMPEVYKAYTKQTTSRRFTISN